MIRDRRINAFQSAFVFLFAVVGAITAAFLTGDHRGSAAIAGGFAGVVVGALASGFLLMLLPLVDLRHRFYVKSTDAMTGHEHNRVQIAGRTMVLKVITLHSLGFLLAMLVTLEVNAAFAAILLGSLLLLPLATWALRQRCPFCHGTLAIDLRKTYYGENCHCCGRSFCETVPPRNG